MTAPAAEDVPVFAVNDIYTSIQGEGCLSGIPMVVVRLHGCSVGCTFCDTKETWHKGAANRVASLADALGPSSLWALAEPSVIAQHAHLLAGERISWVLLTGGEPATQALEPLVHALHKKGFGVAIETSGTFAGHIGAGLDWVCVSPKVGNPGGLPVLREAVATADEIKWLVGRVDDIERFATFVAEYRDVFKLGAELLVQPMSASKKAPALCVDACLVSGWRLSVQVHKLLNIR